MALEFYVEQADRSPVSAVANESVYAGELIHDDGDGADVLTYAATDEDDPHLGLARFDAEKMAAETEEDVVEEVYDSGQRVQYQPLEEAGARVRVRTPEDNSTDPAPSIGHQDVVGVIDAAGATAASAGEFQGRIVQEGYTDDAATTYDRGSGNFKALGVAYRPGLRANQPVTDFDFPVRVRIFGDLEESA